METEKRKKEIIILIIIVSILIIGTCLLIFKRNNKENDNQVISASKVKVYSQNTTDRIKWNNHDTIVVDPGEIDAVAYSFDGGLNWQESNEYTITNNGRFNIVIKDKSGKTTAAVSHTVNSIDNVAPIITIDLPSQVTLNETIDLKKFVSATDDFSGVDGEIIITPKTIDTTILGTKTINYQVKDKAGNITSINVAIDIVEKIEEPTQENENNEQSSNDNNSNNSSSNNSSSIDSSPQNNKTEKYITLYRYRVKKSNTYTCKTYDCSYYSASDNVEQTQKYVETGKCNANYNKILTFRNGCYITPGNPDAMCTQAITKKERYSLYNGNYIDIIALLKDGTQESSSTSTENNIKEKEETNNSSSTISPLPSVSSKYKAEPCDKNEISINGYCHAICSKPTYTCPSGYKLIDNKCQKYITKTCSDKCTSYSWSDWSEWSETKVISTDEIQVETKTVER